MGLGLLGDTICEQRKLCFRGMANYVHEVPELVVLGFFVLSQFLCYPLKYSPVGTFKPGRADQLG